MSASAFGTTVIILNSYKRAMEIFEDPRKNTIYSSRPYVAMTGELMGYDKTIGLLPYGPTFRNSRKYFQKELGNNAGISSFHPQEEQQAKAFVRQVLKSPDDLLEHAFQYVWHPPTIVIESEFFPSHAAAIILRIGENCPLCASSLLMVNKRTDTRPKNAMTKWLLVATKLWKQSINRHCLEDSWSIKSQYVCSVLVSFCLGSLCTILAVRYIPAWVPGAGFQKVAAEWKKLVRQLLRLTSLVA